VRERLMRGELLEVLPQLRGRSRPFSVIYAPHRRQSAAARAMIELLVGNAAENGAGRSRGHVNGVGFEPIFGVCS